ncbi:MAG TPA: VIT family protein [Candidatus Paceibacterota bacterium]|nr:VIT family protein [Candidatus Paceibacterota bacterium]
MQVHKTPHEEEHKSHRAGWLRAAVLGVDDGIVSTSSIMLGVIAAAQSDAAILTAGIAGLFAGALSMAAGEYVSVSSQKDSELYDIAIERKSLKENPEEELKELASIYESRGLDRELAAKVADQLHAHDAVGAHARDELNIDHEDLAKPMQAAVASAISFFLGGAIPIIAAVAASHISGVWIITVVSLIALAVSGAVGAIIGGGNKLWAALRVFLGGGLAMAVTYGIGYLVGVSL